MQRGTTQRGRRYFQQADAVSARCGSYCRTCTTVRVASDSDFQVLCGGRFRLGFPVKCQCAGRSNDIRAVLVNLANSRMAQCQMAPAIICCHSRVPTHRSSGLRGRPSSDPRCQKDLQESRFAARGACAGPIGCVCARRVARRSTRARHSRVSLPNCQDLSMETVLREESRTACVLTKVER
jgi:hypothetical protein